MSEYCSSSYTEGLAVVQSILVMQETKSASERLEQVLREKDKENKRLRDSFETLKNHNETLKRQVPPVYA